MFIIKVKLLVFVYSYIFHKSQGLERLAPEENDIILVTEVALRNITNSLFIELKLQSNKLNTKLKQFLLVHKFFTSVTLKDHKTLNEIIRLTRIDKSNTSNETQHFIVVINEILNEGSSDVKKDSLEQSEDVIHYVDDFLNNLQGFKETSGYNNNYDTLDIKNEIIHILGSSNYQHSQVNETDANFLGNDSMTSNEFWASEPETRRIYKGDRVKIKYFPFVASIQVFNNFQCAGSIIKSDLIITAASCLQLAWNNRFFRENPAFLSARVGSNFYNGGGENIPVLMVYFHPQYNPRNLRHNIAILRLIRHLKFRKHKRRLKKIDFDRFDSALPMTTEGITIIGWGARETSNIVQSPWTNQLAFAVLDVYDYTECQEIYSREYVTRTNFCAGFVSKGGGACNHDVGGPGVVNGILKGVISFGSPVCGARDAPTVFTKLGFYVDWIEEILEEEPPTGYKRTTRVREPLPFTDPLKPLKKTTFKIRPIGGSKMIPIPFNENDENLRIIDDEQLFKDFLDTMFGSKEAKGYKDLLNENPINKAKDDDFELQMHKSRGNQIPDEDFYDSADYDGDAALQETTTPVPAVPVTKMSVIEDSIHPHTVAMVNGHKTNEEYDSAVEIQKIEKLLKSIASGDTDTSSDNDKRKEVLLEIAEETTTNNLKRKLTKKNKDVDSVMTLLYISDNEKTNSTLQDIGNVIQDFDDDLSDGMNIALEGFADLTFRQNNTQAQSMLDILSKTELYDLLSQAIDEVAQNTSVS